MRLSLIHSFSRCLSLLDLLFYLLGLLAALSLHILVFSFFLSVFLFCHSLEIVEVLVVVRVQELVFRVHLIVQGAIIAFAWRF
jgi:hypothetical protein